MVRLHVNVDHVATLREARRISEPDPVAAAALCEHAGAQGITIHLREDRRHIQDHDLRLMRKKIKTLLNLEMALVPEIAELAIEVKPDQTCLVPEKRHEITTEGGLDVIKETPKLKEFIPELRKAGIAVSLFVDPDLAQIERAAELRAEFIELHTGAYANAKGTSIQSELRRLKEAARIGKEAGLRINAGHGLHYSNVTSIAQIPEVEELNIGHSIISRSIFVGITQAVREMKEIVDRAAPVVRR